MQVPVCSLLLFCRCYSWNGQYPGYSSHHCKSGRSQTAPSDARRGWYNKCSVRPRKGIDTFNPVIGCICDADDGFDPRVKGRPWCTIPPTPVRSTASLPSGWKNTRLTSIHEVGNVSHVQAHTFLSKPKQYFWLLFFFFISCASGAFHSSTTPDQDCSVFAGLKFHDPPLLFDLEADPSEYYPLSLNNRPDLQEVLGRIRKVKEQFEGSMVFGESQISKGKDESLEPCCSPQCSPKPDCCHCWWDTCLHLWRDNAQFSTFILNIFKMFMVIHRWSGEAFLFIV